jgi:hypothetical protein
VKKPIALTVAALALPLLASVPAGAWISRGGSTAAGGRWGAAACDGHWAAGANGHGATGTYGTTSSGEHYATSSRGGSATAQNGSWSAIGANGHTNSGTYGTTAYGTHYATGSYGGAVATNDGHWAAEDNGNYAYGSHYAGSTTYAGAYHPPTVVNQYYGTGCYNCGGWSAAGAAAAGAAAGVALGTAIGVAAASPPPAAVPVVVAPYAIGDVYVALPQGCTYAPVGGKAYYACNGAWFHPYYGANGLYYAVVPAPS